VISEAKESDSEEDDPQMHKKCEKSKTEEDISDTGED
jgi:hypothetical protein